jgi:Ca2+-binding EF-hand superfamily protein
MDDNNSRSLDKYEFTKACGDFMLGFTEGEMQKLFNYFDYDRSGLLEYDEFIRAIRGPMNQTRQKICMQAYAVLDRDGNGWVDINDVKGVYNASKHPDVIQGKKTEDQILQEFLETFETQHAMRNNGTPDYVVTKEEFIEYYNNISASIDDDQYFKLMIENAWKLTKESRQGMGTKGWANEDAGGSKGASSYAPKGRAQGGGGSTANRLFGTAAAEKPKNVGVPESATEEMLLTNLRERLAKRGTRGISSIGRKFKIADDDRSGNLNKTEFVKAMHDFRIGMNDRQCAQVYNVFDRDGSGEVSYDEFLRTIRG